MEASEKLGTLLGGWVVGVGVAVAVAVLVAVAVAVGFGVFVAVGVCVGVAVGFGVFVAVGFGVFVAVGFGVFVAVGVCVGVAVGFGVFVAVGFGVFVAVGVCVGVAVGFGVFVAVGFGVFVAVGFGVFVAVGVCVGVNVASGSQSRSNGLQCVCRGGPECPLAVTKTAREAVRTRMPMSSRSPTLSDVVWPQLVPVCFSPESRRDAESVASAQLRHSGLPCPEQRRPVSRAPQRYEQRMVAVQSATKPAD